MCVCLCVSNYRCLAEVALKGGALLINFIFCLVLSSRQLWMGGRAGGISTKIIVKEWGLMGKESGTEAF